MSKPTPPVHPTRQQLDDLEALMQRMLALPVNQLEGDVDSTLTKVPPVHVPPEWENAPAEPPIIVNDYGRDLQNQELSAARGIGPAELVSEPEPRNAFKGFGPWPTPAEPEPQRDDNIGAHAANLTIVDRTAPRARTWQPIQGRRRTPIVVRPLVWTNRAFDRWAGKLGRPGRWLRGPRGRTLLGSLGLLFLALAASWAVLAWIGWTQ